LKLTTEQKNYFLAYVNKHKHELVPSNMRMGYDGSDMPDPIESERNIRREGNHIYFYDYVDVESQLILEKMLKRCSLELLSDHVGEIMNGELSETVVIHLHSPGGLGHSGFALYDFIKSSKLPITCVVSGLCASAATLIMLACENRVMSPSSTFLMHQCSWGGYGENRYMQDLAYNAKRSMQVLINIYMKETHIAEKDENGNLLTKEQRAKRIADMLEHDIEFTRDECVEYGISSKPKQNVELSDERVEILNSFMDKLLQEQAEENAAIDAVGEVCCKCAEEVGEVELNPEGLEKLKEIASALIEEQKKAKEKEEQKKAREKAKAEKEKTVVKKSTTKKTETKTTEKPVKKETKPKTTKK
jgi:ATP-dependent protease ClpP protease subunit